MIQNEACSAGQGNAAKAKVKDWYDWFWPPIWSNWVLAVAAFVAALIALRSLRVAQDTAKRQLRAYVFADHAQRARDSAGNFSIKVEIKNSGQTPAYDCISFIGVTVFHMPLDPSKLTPPPPSGRSIYPIGPGGTKELGGVMKPLHQYEEIAISQGKKAIFVYWQIKYRNELNNHQFTNFRLFCTGERFPAGRFAAHDEGNEAT